MAVLLTYDIRRTTNTIHAELKQALIEQYGYSAQIQASTGAWYALPNTCLRKDNIAPQAAWLEFVAACAAVGAVWEKYIASDYVNASFNNQNP